jgi:dihydrofolate reductase
MISIIAAMDNDRVIGNNNSLPWNLPADMKRFKNLTAGKPIIMGSKTFESIGKALPDRDNIVLTDDENYKDREIMICGGASVYGQFLDRADRMYLTIIDHKFKGDAFFPEFDQSQWQEKENIRHEPDENNRYHYSFLTLDRKT